MMSADVKFTHLSSATQDEVRDVVMKSPSKLCQLGSLPTKLLESAGMSAPFDYNR